MTLTDLLKEVVKTLKSTKAEFALAGGLAASVYRKEPRTTQDIDMLLLLSNSEKTLSLAEKTLRKFDMTIGIARKAELEGGPMFATKRKSTPPYLVVGRDKIAPTQNPGLDFILPDMPWFKKALERAQVNEIDFGFGKIPCLTVEDVIIAKCAAWQNRKDRFRDLDDLQSIFAADHKLDLTYLSDRMFELQVPIPKEVIAQTPEALAKLSKKIKAVRGKK